jgi:peptidoglycan/LPS O-acetylase OafA/YrhL
LTSIHPKYRPDITGLRAIAVLVVIAFHAFPTIVPGGFIGVDIFFVISGYLISSIILSNLEEHSFSYRDFYARRIRRIFPALIVVLLACLVFGWSALPPDEYRQLGAHIASGAAFISNFTLWNESGYFDSASKPLLHLWSLGIEEQFYIVWPLLLGIAWQRRQNFLVVIVVIAVVSFAANVATVGGNPVAAFYSPLTRFWELMIGGILAYLALHRPGWHKRAPNLQAAIGMVLVAFGVFAFSKTSSYPGWRALLPTCGAFLLISAGPAAVINRRLLGHPLMQQIGLISYPLYLWHWPLLFAIYNYNDATPISSQRLYWPAKLVAIAASFALSFATYRFLEIPAQRRAWPWITQSLVLGMLALGIGGLLLVQTRGLEYRFPRDISETVNFRYDSDKAYRHGTCFLEITDDSSKFSNCTSRPRTPNGTSIVLWGDSHAAHLYPGLEGEFGSTVVITQLTTGSCAPILGHSVPGSPNCERNNEFVAEKIKSLNPTLVILAAGWTRYPYWPELQSTIHFLSELNIKQIAIVGPAPHWSGSLQKQIFRNYRTTGAPDVPERLTYGFDPDVAQLDTAMERFAVLRGVRYISLSRILCDQRGCLARVGTSPDTLTAFDYDHFTTAGSVYVVRHFPEWFFNELGTGDSIN